MRSKVIITSYDEIPLPLGNRGILVFGAKTTTFSPPLVYPLQSFIYERLTSVSNYFERECLNISQKDDLAKQTDLVFCHTFKLSLL